MVLLKSEMKELQMGDSAPDFELKNTDEQTVKLSDFKGKAVAIIFMCNHCPYVIPKMDEIKQLQDDFADKNIAVICINPNNNPEYPEDDFPHMQELAKEKGFTYYLFDEDQSVAKSYGAVCTPDPYVFDTDHKLVFHGRINDAMNPNDTPSKHDLREVLDAIAAGNDVVTDNSPSMGCSIKWVE